MMNVLVTGGKGQLASCIRDVEKTFDNLNLIYTDYQNLDISNLEEVNKFFCSNKIDYCINCAAYTAVDKAEEEPDKAFQVNAIGAKNLAIACKGYNVVLVQVSTDFVFDGNKHQPYNETDITKPISVYGASKLQGELDIQENLKEYFIVRTSWLYSEHGNNFMKTMLRLAKTRDEISVVNDQVGTPTYATDLAIALLSIIQQQSKTYGVYHYSNNGAVSWYDFAKAIFELSSSSIKLNAIPTIEFPTPARRPKYSILDKTKIVNTFKVKVPEWKVSLEQVVLKIK